MKDSVNVSILVDSLKTVLKQNETSSLTTAAEYGWVLNLGVDIIYTLGAVAGVIWFVRILLKGKDPKEELMKNPAKSFNILAALSSLIEVVTLTAASVTRGNPFSTSFGGYMLIAIIEVFMVYLVMIEVGKILADGKINVKEEWGNILKCFIWMAATFITTTAIFHLYKEAMGADTIFSEASSGFWDILGLKTEYTGVRLEKRSIFLIYSTELFMILGIIFEWNKRVGNPVRQQRPAPSTSWRPPGSSGSSGGSGLTREQELEDLLRSAVGPIRNVYQQELDSIRAGN